MSLDEETLITFWDFSWIENEMIHDWLVCNQLNDISVVKRQYRSLGRVRYLALRPGELKNVPETTKLHVRRIHVFSIVKHVVVRCCPVDSRRLVESPGRTYVYFVRWTDLSFIGSSCVERKSWRKTKHFSFVSRFVRTVRPQPKFRYS